MVGTPSTANQQINSIQIVAPYFKVKFSNGNIASRDVNLSYVAIEN